MQLTHHHQGLAWQANLYQGTDLCIPLRAGEANPNCYYADAPRFETIRQGDFVGSVAEGGSVNYQKITLTPHGNGTHTECYGHISPDRAVNIASLPSPVWAIAQLISLTPQPAHHPTNDKIVLEADLKKKLGKITPEALIIRTLPNGSEKLQKQYSGTNPPFLEPCIGAYLAELGVKHLLVDLPSVDKEQDNGTLLVHKGFWNYPPKPRIDATITELIFVPNHLPDGWYLLCLQIGAWETDAAPSRPVIYPTTPQK
ncbi:cyclase family protein [Eisenibacter elegans]|uniref:cyclase family protein n=1 Tax=Eisenibacter elegans TaxID=997 RepID=UPI000415B795|nr:cyclase family protein [Eisenibacter elegans]